MLVHYLTVSAISGRMEILFLWWL